MATKKITDLTLRTNFDATCNVPVDDSSQTWRVTGAQIATFVNAASAVKSVRYKTASTQSIPGSSATTIIDFDSVDYDSSSLVTTGASWNYEASRTGVIRIFVAVACVSTPQIYLYVYVNGVRKVGLAVGSTFGLYTGASELAVTAGDLVDIRATNLTTATTLAADSELSWIAISEVI